MAGNYPDVPGPRMAWDRDGSALFTITGGVTAVRSQSEMNVLNNESNNNVELCAGNSFWWGVVFPEQRDIVGYFLATSAGGDTRLRDMQTSSDTTNGQDGTWTSVLAGTFSDQASSAVKPANRSNIASVNWLGVKGVRFVAEDYTGATTSRAYGYTWHLYGAPAAGEAPDKRLSLWHPTLDQEVDGAYFDWGDVQRSSTVTRDFRVKNQSSTLTAESIDLSMEALTDTNPSNVSQHSFSDDGGVNYAATINIGNLAPGAISPVLTLRRVTDPSAPLSVWTTRMIADAATWA